MSTGKKSKEKNLLRKLGVSAPIDPKHMEWVVDAVDDSGCKPSNYKNLPKTLADCPYSSGKPCSFFRCRHNLYLTIFEGRIRFNFPGQEFWEIPETCSLRVADRGGMTLEECGEAMNLTRERVRQVQEQACYGSPKHKTIGGAARKFMAIPDAVDKKDAEKCKRLWAAARKVEL